MNDSKLTRPRLSERSKRLTFVSCLLASLASGAIGSMTDTAIGLIAESVQVVSPPLRFPDSESVRMESSGSVYESVFSLAAAAYAAQDERIGAQAPEANCDELER